MELPVHIESEQKANILLFGFYDNTLILLLYS